MIRKELNFKMGHTHSGHLVFCVGDSDATSEFVFCPLLLNYPGNCREKKLLI